MTELAAENISVSAGGNTLLSGASLTLCAGELVAVLGPNGAGKTTLLRALLGYIKPQSGRAVIGGDDAQTLSPIMRARRVSYLPQTRPMAWPNIVRDVVALGRYSHGASLGRLSAKDAAAVDSALAACDITHLESRRADTLSGGELARVHCARAFAAQAPFLIADEPTAALDPRHQYRVMDLMRSFASGERGALIVLHDVSLAAQYADRLIWMKDGRIEADGTPQETLSEQRLAHIYGVKARVNGLRVHIDGAL